MASTRAGGTADRGREKAQNVRGEADPKVASSTAVPDLLDLVGIEPGEITAERVIVLELGTTYHLLMRFIAETLDKVGLTPQQYGILEVLARRVDGIGQDDLRTIMVCSRPNLSGLVDRMVKLELVASRALSTDRRCRTLTITARGKALLRRARPVYRLALQHLFQPVSPSDRERLVDLIREFRKPLEALSGVRKELETRSRRRRATKD